MSIQEELGFTNPITHSGHETILNIVLTGSMLAKESDRLLRPLGLTDAQFNILMLLRFQAKGGAINQTCIGGMLLVNRSNVTGLVDRIEKAGWVERVPDPKDRRVNMVRLTTDGKRLVDRAEKAYFKRVEELMGSISKKERQQLCLILERLRNRLRGV